MKSRRLASGAIAGLVLVGLFAFKVEHIEEVCSLTGASRRYERYYSIISTRPETTESWIDSVLEANGQLPVDHQWVCTKGDTWTLGSFYRSHNRAPKTYHVRSLSVPFLRETFSEQQLNALAEAFASGNLSRQTVASNTVELMTYPAQHDGVFKRLQP